MYEVTSCNQVHNIHIGALIIMCIVSKFSALSYQSKSKQESRKHFFFFQQMKLIRGNYYTGDEFLRTIDGVEM